MQAQVNRHVQSDMYPSVHWGSRIYASIGEDLVTQASRLTLSTIALTCLLSLAGATCVQAQGLKTNSGNFGSGWQVGGAGDATRQGGTDADAGSAAAGSPGSSGAGYSGYSGSYGSGSAPGSYGGSSGSYGSPGSGYGGYGAGNGAGAATSERMPAVPDPASTFSAPRGAGGGLRTQ